MKNYWLMVLLLTTYCLASPDEARSQSVSAYSEVSYFAPSNSMYAFTEAYPDYSSQLYYCVNVYGPVYKDGNQEAWLYGTNRIQGDTQTPCGGEATAEAFLPYDANAEYTVEGNSEVELQYRNWNESGYEDYYNYYAYGLVDPIYYPLSFGFAGAGPPGSISPPNIWLGTVYSIFTQGATSSYPHHLQVVDDRYDIGGCGQQVRFTKFKIVDAYNHPAGGVKLKEIFHPANIVDTCSNATVHPETCSQDYPGHSQGTFTDQTNVGCPGTLWFLWLRNLA
jgi:hypothetical protein